MVGEDLGNVPVGFRERMETARILSYRLLPFEREYDGRYRPPEAYPRFAVATAGTHDLPPLAGWALGRDIVTRREAHLISAETARAALNERRRDVEFLLQALVQRNEMPAEDAARAFAAVERGEPETAAFAPLAVATYGYLGRTPSCLVFVQLDDAVVSFDQANLPVR